MSQSGITKSEISELLTSSGRTPKRSLGQNFLIDQNYARKIADIAAGDGGPVAEIGPGIGSLTVFLAERCERVTAVEKDEEIASLLSRVLESRGIANVEVIVADALEVDWGDLLELQGIRRVVGNLPYNVSVPIIMKLVQGRAGIQGMAFLLQKEVAERLAAEPGTRESSAVSLKLQLRFAASIVDRVPATVFMPVPNVASAVLEMRADSRYLDLYGREAADAAVGAARAAFAHRRQMLRRTLAGDRFAAALASSGVEETRRPESLTIEEWLAIGVALKGKGPDHA
ncbi:MAG: 16S rRNA (adenine(1518)-N(6)/adenine(1519)-N(6))-dimethyltransferase RsmA [Actinomycetota bacterium]|nr:16S rRNA (adenine(1518)-N(6)/adenine(1519)-N(6))-dimethyltransferase RsmA [Actinomycetota bacterium]